jgi:hypothetical protein
MRNRWSPPRPSPLRSSSRKRSSRKYRYNGLRAKPRHVASHSYSDAPVYREPAPRPAPQPNYVAIGTGAVVGGLLGNQVGGGNGKKLATIAGVIGGGMLGNQIANSR